LKFEIAIRTTTKDSCGRSVKPLMPAVNGWMCYKFTIKEHTCPSLLPVCEPRSSCCEESSPMVLPSVRWSTNSAETSQQQIRWRPWWTSSAVDLRFCAICGSDYSYSVSPVHVVCVAV